MLIREAPIGIFDSGLGGLSVLKECIKSLPNEHYIYFGDSKFAPYGSKSNTEIIERCIYICDYLIDKGVKAIIVACNTATSVAIEILRSKYTIPIIGMEPALKPAVEDKIKQYVVVMATTVTLKENKFSKLLESHKDEHTIIKMPCPLFVDIIEQDMDQRNELVRQQIDMYHELIKDIHVDTIVLGCTHFYFLKQEIRQYFNYPVLLIDGHQGTIRQLIKLLSDFDLLAHQDRIVEVFNSDPTKLPLSFKLLNS